MPAFAHDTGRPDAGAAWPPDDGVVPSLRLAGERPSFEAPCARTRKVSKLFVVLRDRRGSAETPCRIFRSFRATYPHVAKEWLTTQQAGQRRHSDSAALHELAVFHGFA